MCYNTAHPPRPFFLCLLQASRLVSIKDEHARLMDEGQKMQAKNETLQVLSICFLKRRNQHGSSLSRGNNRYFRGSTVDNLKAYCPIDSRPQRKPCYDGDSALSVS